MSLSTEMKKHLWIVNMAVGRNDRSLLSDEPEKPRAPDTPPELDHLEWDNWKPCEG